MRNLLGKSHCLQPSNRLKSGVLGCGEGGVVEVELGLEGEDVFIELAVVEDFGVKPPVVKVLYSLVEFLILDGCPLKGFLKPKGKNFWRVESAVERGGIDLFDIGEVPCTIVLAVPHNASIVELFDPFGRDVRSFSQRDGEHGQPIVSDIPVRSFDKGLLIVEETGLGKLEVFLQLVDCSLVFFVLGPDLALILLMMAVRSLDKGIDNGAECGWFQMGGCDGVMNRLG